jgi:hypothetical protein
MREEALMKVSPPLRRTWRALKYYGYGQGWLNARSRRRFEASRPELGAVQAKAMDDLKRDGFALVDAAALFAGSGLWEAAREAGREFAGSELVRQGIESYLPRAGTAGGKDYLVRLRDSWQSLPPDDLWLRIGLSPALLDVVSSYLGLWPKLNFVDVWYTVPSPAERQAVASQRWHRDPDDRKLVKAFLYLADVDAGAGPLEYVRGSHGRGPHARRWPGSDLGTASYPPEGAVEAEILPADRVSCTGPAGTLVLCDTYGLHRGGFAREHARVLATWAYVTPASIFARRFEASWPRGSAGFTEAAEFAVR